MLSGRGLRLAAKAVDVAGLRLPVVAASVPEPGAGEVLVEVRAAAVNPSDVKAALGMMPYAVFPRTPGRDFAGVVVAGASAWLGREVFGTSGDLGIRRDGSHATHLLVEADAVVAKPDGVSLVAAAGIGVPFVTAIEGFSRAGMPRAGEVVLVLGVNGKVGQAAAQIAAWCGARVLGVVRKPEPYAGHACAAVTIIDASAVDVAREVRGLTDGHGADIVFNTVGDPYFAAAQGALAVLGRQILIATIARAAPFDIFAFYRGRHTYVGIDTLALSSCDSAAALRRLLPGFADGALRPFPIEASARYGLDEAVAAYAAVMGSARERVILVPD
jgi:NADPH:quinone reductase-like Zn-dependent oxidoreductase